MRNGCKKLASMFLITVLLAACSSKEQEEIHQMDFQAQIDWKAPAPAVGERPRILFVGNSHIFYNDLSGTFVRIADAFGYRSDVYELSKGYYSLRQYANPEDTLGALFDSAVTNKKWDFVVLQENISVALSDSPDEDMFPYARILDEKVKSAGGQTAFLMTWAPKDGKKEGFKKQSCQELQSVVAENYMTISDELDDLVIPAGIGFMRCADSYPEIELWDEDGYHPSPAGTYLTACIVYATVYQESPENCSYIADLDTELAGKLQEIAADVVLGNGTSTAKKIEGHTGNQG